ncbi:unnamed protein product [Rotaria sordida]|uniref:Uncharacterized protein n=1 Tax=Rotaria sordida TaxID=392033 RepID=A0A819PQV0_9BILA|nr:unnamed protein product [Rotaria sordida]
MPCLEDITVISTDAGALHERIEAVHENRSFETPSGRKIIFCPWSHRAGTDGKTVTKLKRSIGKFVSYVAQTITTNWPDAEKISFSTCRWENFNVEADFAEELIIEIQRLLKNQLCKEFIQALIRLQSDEDGFVQFSCSVSTTRRVNIIETKLEENETAWETVSINDVDNENPTHNDDDIDDQLKTAEEIKKIQELDNPNRKWKQKKLVTEAFMKQKIRNIIEFQQLCDRQTNL